MYYYTISDVFHEIPCPIQAREYIFNLLSAKKADKKFTKFQKELCPIQYS